MTGIYKITSPTGKIYIGQSVDIKNRWSQHKFELGYKHIKSKLKNSFKKHSFENHKFEVQEECPVELLNNRERFWQDYYNVLGPNGLNLLLVESSLETKVYSEESKHNISQSLKKYNSSLTEEQRVVKNRKTSESMKGITLGRKHTEETKLLLSKRNTGKKHTPEAIEKIRQASKSRIITEEFREAVRKAWVKRKLKL